MNRSDPSLHQRRHLHFDALVSLARRRFEQVPEQRRAPHFSLADVLMAALALFALKDPSLLAFCRRALDHNLRSVFGLLAVPSDTQMRTILDEVPPDRLRPAFTDLFRQVQRGKILEEYVFLEGCYLIALDGVEYFCSQNVHCEYCLSRQHPNGTVSYYHQLLGAVIVHPDLPEVIPLTPEPIQRQDGQSKNDCERNAARRWLKHFRQDHPHLPVIITEDALSSNAPHIRDLQAARCHFLLGVKPGDHAHLFEQVYRRVEKDEVEVHDEVETGTGKRRHYLFVKDLSLNEANPEVRVNFLRCAETDAQEECDWAWVTDLNLTAANFDKGGRGARARWHIENETFNTLKNQGYHFEHNYGHGEKHLAVVMALLMMLAFGIDQVQQKSNDLFRAAWAKKGPKCALWEAVRQLFTSFEVSSMREIYEAMAFGYERPHLKPQRGPALPREKAADTS